MDYFLKASAIILLFYTCYKLFLQRDTFFQANRWFLLSGIFIATVLPLIVIPVYIQYTPQDISISQNLQVATIQTTTKSGFNLWQLLPIIYGIGSLIILVKVILQFISLHKLLQNKTKIQSGPFVFIKTEASIAPFSFFNRIVYNPSQFLNTELDYIITHEKVHATQYHTIDVIVIQLATILFWFNPFIWWYKKELQQNLEYIADQKAQHKIKCSKSYQTVLLKASLHQNQLAIPTNFYQSLIKKRIVMLQKSKSKNSNLLKLTIVLPFLGLFLMSFNTKKVYIANAEIQQHLVNTETYIITSKSTDQEIQAIKSKLESKLDHLEVKFSNIKRNQNQDIISLTIATKNKGQSEFIKRVDFNKLDNSPINTTILKVEDNQLLISDDKNKSVITVTKDWTITSPVITEQASSNTNVIHTQNSGDDIKLIIENKDQDSSVSSYKFQTTNIGEDKSKLVIVEQQKKPLYVINDKITDIMPSALNTENIATMNVLKGQMATNKYGSQGLNGVIEITTNNKNLEKNSNWKIGKKVETTSLFYIDEEDASKNRSTLHIDKNTPDLVLNQHKAFLTSQNIDIQFSTIKRNNKDEIIKIKISTIDKKGNKTKTTYQSNKGISPIEINLDGTGVLNITSK